MLPDDHPTHFDFGGLDEDPVSMAITMERNEGDLPRQQVLATYRHSLFDTMFVPPLC